MIEQAVTEIEPLVGTLPACRALGASRASVYRWRDTATAQTAQTAAALAAGAVRARARRRARAIAHGAVR